MPSFSPSSVFAAAAMADTALACVVTRYRRPRLTASEPAAEPRGPPPGRGQRPVCSLVPAPRSPPASQEAASGRTGSALSLPAAGVRPLKVGHRRLGVDIEPAARTPGPLERARRPLAAPVGRRLESDCCLEARRRSHDQTAVPCQQSAVSAAGFRRDVTSRRPPDVARQERRLLLPPA